MRSLPLVLVVSIAACGDSVDPRGIPGGGIGDGEIDGNLYVHVIDSETYDAIGGATVEVAGKQYMTDVDGLAKFSDLSGKQTITVKAGSYRPAVWVGANGTNVTVPLTIDSATPDSATLSGSIAGWDTITVPAQHYKAAAVVYSQTDELGNPKNDLKTPNNMNICGLVGQTCDFQVVSRAGTVTLVAMIIDGDTKGTADPSDDVQKVIGWATKQGITVEKGVNQSGLSLAMVEAGNLQTVTIDYGSPPAALTDHAAIVGIEVSKDEIIQIPLFVNDRTMVLAPKPTVFAADAKYRLSAVAQTTSGDQGAQSIVIHQHLTGTSLEAGTWLEPPTGVTASRTSVSLQAVAGATLYSVQFLDPTNRNLLEITSLDGTLSLDVPPLVALPASGVIHARAQALGVDFDPTDFSLDTDKDKVWGLGAQPATIN
jgi:hypothetical protein